MKALHMVLPSECSSIFGLSLSVGEDMAGENGHGGSVPDHRVDVLEPPSLSLFTASVPLTRAPSFSPVVVPT